MVLFVVVPSLLVRLLLAIAGVLRLAMFRSGVPQWIITITYAEMCISIDYSLPLCLLLWLWLTCFSIAIKVLDFTV